MMPNNGVGSNFTEEEERIRGEGAFSQCFFRQTVAIISIEGRFFHGPLGEGEL